MLHIFILEIKSRRHDSIYYLDDWFSVSFCLQFLYKAHLLGLISVGLFIL